MNSSKRVTAYLTQIYGENLNKKFKLSGSEVTIGRSAKSCIRLKNLNISRSHCTLLFSDGTWKCRDNRSQNGTFISGQKLNPAECRLLECGDIIFLGPPSEMPEAFCFDDAFIDPELPEDESKPTVSTAKRPAECEVANLPKKRNSSIESPEIIIDTAFDYILPSISNEHIGASFTVETIARGSSNRKKPVKTNEKDRNNFSAGSSSSKPPELNRDSVEIVPSVSSPFIMFNSDYNRDQVNEVSSTGDDQVEDSLSLIGINYNDLPDPFSSPSTSENATQKPSGDPPMSEETEVLRSKLALLSQQVKKLEKSKSVLQKNYEVVCEKNKTLDEQLADKKILEENLKNCETRVKDEVKTELLEKFEEDLICNICTELLIKPTVLDCSHSFCLHCIKEWKKKKNECPICRSHIQTMTPVLTLENFIDKALETLTPEQREKRAQVIKERENPPRKPPTPSRRYGRRRGSRRSVAGSSIRRYRQPLVQRANADVEIVGERSALLNPLPSGGNNIRGNVLARPITSNISIPITDTLLVRISDMLGNNDSFSFIIS